MKIDIAMNSSHISDRNGITTLQNNNVHITAIHSNESGIGCEVSGISFILFIYVMARLSCEVQQRHPFLRHCTDTTPLTCAAGPRSVRC